MLLTGRTGSPARFLTGPARSCHTVVACRPGRPSPPPSRLPAAPGADAPAKRWRRAVTGVGHRSVTQIATARTVVPERNRCRAPGSKASKSPIRAPPWVPLPLVAGAVPLSARARASRQHAHRSRQRAHSLSITVTGPDGAKVRLSPSSVTEARWRSIVDAAVRAMATARRRTRRPRAERALY